MLPIITGRDGDKIKIEVTVELSGSMLEAEEAILRAVNAVGNVATGEALKRFDADGEPIVVAGTKLYSKGKLSKIYNTPYGVVSAERDVTHEGRHLAQRRRRVAPALFLGLHNGRCSPNGAGGSISISPDGGSGCIRARP